MRRLGAAALVLLVALAAGYLGLRVVRGLNFHTDLLALLPVGTSQHPTVMAFKLNVRHL